MKLKAVNAVIENENNHTILAVEGWGGPNIADMGETTPETLKQANRIVKCVNAHDELVEAARKALACLENLHDLLEWDKSPHDEIDEAIDAENALASVLAKLEETK